MKIIITFEDSNAAFIDNGMLEYKNIFKQAIEAIYEAEGKDDGNKLLDSNGNTVGYIAISRY